MNHRTEIARFIGSKDNFNESDIILLGLPYDCTSSFRSGSRFAMREIRNYAWEGIEDFSFHFGLGLEDVRFSDIGDLPVMVGNPALMVETVRNEISAILEFDKRVLVVGGEHLITYPVYLSHKEKYENITVIQLDAHADLRDAYAGDSLSHASVMKLCLDSGLNKLIQWGIRSGTREEYLLRKHDNRIYPVDDVAELDDIIKEGENVYLTIDVDFFDPGYFSGTGTPEPGGKRYNDFLDLLDKLIERKVNIIGADVVELAPEIDTTKVSTIFAAKILRELLLTMNILSSS